MYWLLLLLLIPPSHSAGAFGNFRASPPRIVGRLYEDCSSGCPSNEKCCGGVCIQADWACCDDHPQTGGWCTSSDLVCTPCPPGQTCLAKSIYTGELNPVSFDCCQPDICTFIVSTDGGVTTLVSSGSDTVSDTLPPTVSSETTIMSPTIVLPPTTYLPPTTLSPTTIVVTVTSRSTSTLSAPTGPRPTVVPPPKTSTETATIPVIVTAHSTNSFVTSSISSSSRSSVRTWNGTGPLLVGHCATPEFSLLAGAQTTVVFYVGIVGCVGDKADCCPFPVSGATSTVTATVMRTITESITGAGNPPAQAPLLFPAPESQVQITLPRCPDDYQTVSSVCCPSGYLLWDELLGGVTPCYSTVTDTLTPPPSLEVPTMLSSALPSKITSTVVNVVYAMNYPVKHSGLQTPAKAGIGVGAGLAVLGLVALSSLLWRRRRQNQYNMYPHMGAANPSIPSVAGTPIAGIPSP